MPRCVLCAGRLRVWGPPERPLSPPRWPLGHPETLTLPTFTLIPPLLLKGSWVREFPGFGEKSRNQNVACVDTDFP